MLKRIAILTLVATPLLAQVSFRTTVQYVTVDVVVTDHHDKPITDLTKDDFEIIEAGKPQAITDFQFVSVPVVQRKFADNTPRQPDPDVLTNVATSPNSRLFAIVVDDQHLIEQDLVKIKRALTDLMNSFSADDEVALVFVSRSDFSVNFTRNHARLMDRIKNVKAVLGFGIDTLAHVDSPSPLGAVSKPNRFQGMVFQDTQFTLGSVARAMGGSGHTRKAMFVITAGWPIKPKGGGEENQALMAGEGNVSDLAGRNLSQDAASLLTAAKFSNVPVYLIDPRGNVQPEDAVRGGMGGSVTTVMDPKLNAEARGNIRLEHNSLAMIAVNTGGRAVFNTQNITKAVQEFVQENGSYYLLGYYPSPYSSDGKFHGIAVRVKREGARVRARKGYEASSSERSTEPIHDPMQRAMTAGVNVSGLPLRVFAEPMQVVGDRMKVAITAELTYPARTDGSSQYDEHLQVRLLALDPDAKVKGESVKNHRFTAPSPATGTTTLLINDVIELPLQTLTLRVGIGSQELGKAGTVQVGVMMPTEKHVSMGGIAVGIDGVSPTAMLPDAFGGIIPFQPVTARVFAASDTLRLFGHVYARGTGVDPAITMTLAGPSGSRPVLASVQRAGDDFVIDTKLPLKDMAPGKYHLAVSAIVGGGKPVSRDVLFEVR